MKKIFKFLVITLAVVVISAFAGCSARAAISADDFQKQAKSAGFTVAEQNSDNSGATKSFAATKSKSDTQIIYYTFSSDSGSQSWYSTVKSGLTGSGKTVVDSDSYNKYSLTNGEIYYLLVRMDNTGILCKTTVSNKSEADNFINSIKY